MPTKSEAAEALYRAAKPFSVHVEAIYERNTIDKARANLRAALDAYSSAPPDAPPSLPPVVQRVLEAAGAAIEAMKRGEVVSRELNLLRDALDAYRATQPEPLSARLAELKPGVKSVVDLSGGRRRHVVWNDHDERKLLCLDGETSLCTWESYDSIRSILSESP